LASERKIVAALPALTAGNVAVITGAASGIGLAAAKRLAGLGMKLVMADLPGARLDEAARSVHAVAGADRDVVSVATDVSRQGDLARLADSAFELGPVTVLMNNAGIERNTGKPWENIGDFKKILDVNFLGVVHGVVAFAARMLAAAQPGLIINTGSKQGITTPPGNLAYNVSKSALKTYTEGLQHALRNEPGAALSAHLLIPGFTYTGLTRNATEKPPGAWTGEQVIDFMLASLMRGDFYILCPDNETDRVADERRMAWAIGDIIGNRPALSRWHPDHKNTFDAFMRG